MYYKIDKNIGSIFFQAVHDDAILHIAFLYSRTDKKWLCTSFLAVEMEMCEKNVALIQASVKDEGIIWVKPEAWAHTF